MTVRNLAEGLSDLKAWASDPRPRIGFGMDFFDKPTGGGIGRSEICMFQAFSSVGKTTWALNVVRNNPDVPVLVLSLEMNWRMVAMRLVAMEVPTTTQHLESALHAGIDVPELQTVADRYHKLVCDDTPALKIRQASESFEAATEKLGEPPRLVIWDYLERVGGRSLNGKAEQIDKVAGELRDWTRKHDTASIVLHQISGTYDTKNGHPGARPMSIDSGRYGGFQPMDYVVGAYAPRLDPTLGEHQLEAVREDIYFQLLKSRSGQAEPTGQRYRLDRQTMRITRPGTIRDLPRVLGQQTAPGELPPDLVIGSSKPDRWQLRDGETSF